MSHIELVEQIMEYGSIGWVIMIVTWVIVKIVKSVRKALDEKEDN